MQQLDDFIVVSELASCSMHAISLHFMISMVCLICAIMYDHFLLTHILMDIFIASCTMATVNAFLGRFGNLHLPSSVPN